MNLVLHHNSMGTIGEGISTERKCARHHRSALQPIRAHDRILDCVQRHQLAHAFTCVVRRVLAQTRAVEVPSVRVVQREL